MALSWGSQAMNPKRTKDGESLDALMARSMEDASAEPAFMAALLDATVYVHAPARDRPGNLRLVSFPHPQTGAYLVPFFSDRRQAEESSSPRVRIIAMTGRRLFEITMGATLILNPNRRYCLFYPEEVAILLQGRALPPAVRIDDEKELARPLEPVAHPPEWLGARLGDLFAAIPSVEGAAVARYAPSHQDESERLVLVVFVSDADAERTGRAATVALKEACEQTKTSLDVLTVRPDDDVPYCHFPKTYVRRTKGHAKRHGGIH